MNAMSRLAHIICKRETLPKMDTLERICDGFDM